MSQTTARLCAFYALKNVIVQKKSLRDCLPAQLATLTDTRDKGLCNEIVNGSLRQYPSLVQTLDQYVSKSLRKSSDIEVLLASALYQLVYLKTPDYAVVNETLNVAEQTKQHKLKGLINAVLRAFLRDKKAEKVVKDEQYNHPSWLFKRIENDYPEQAERIFEENLRAPNMTLRIRKQSERDAYLEKLSELDIKALPHPDVDSAILLNDKIPFSQLPDIDEKKVVVQDGNAQLAATLLNLESGQDVLDACAAPGGKSVHLMDTNPSINLTAIEQNQSRAEQMKQNFLDLSADIVTKTGDATTIEKWFQGKQFDRILIDAPCSGTGVIRKHPDILHHRKENDIKPLITLQRKLLSACFACLKPKGKLLYATCSILESENQAQIDLFLVEQPLAKLIPLSHSRALFDSRPTLQFLPDKYGTGFFYAMIEKQE